MNRVITAIKKIQLRQVFMTFLAGILLFVSTACSGGPAQAKNPRPEVPGGTATSPRGDVINTYKGPMNDFSDVDPRSEKFDNAAQGKAQDLVKNAEQNLQKRADTPEKYVKNYQEGTPLGERVKRFGEDVKGSTEDVKEGVSKGTQKGVENVKGNTQDATKEVTKGASQAVDNAKENTKAAGRNVVNKTQDAVDNTSNVVKGKVNDAAKGAQRNLDKAGNAIKDTVD